MINTIQNIGLEVGNAEMYELDLQINEESLKAGPTPQRSSNCTVMQCRTNSGSDCTSCWNNC